MLRLLLLLAPLLAANSFHYGKVRFEPVDAFAYQAEVEGEKAPVTIVALTSYKIDRPAVLAAIEPGQAFYAQAGERGNVVMVTLARPEECRVSGYLASTMQSVGLGSFHAKTKTSSTARVAGDCFTDKPGKMFDDEYDFHLSYDVPITAIPKPSTLPAGGGEPGAHYLALVKAIQTNDWNVAHLRLRPDEVPDKKPDDLKEYFRGIGLNYPKTATIAGGLLKGDRAQLDLRGVDYDGKKIKGVVALKKAGSDWRVIDQQFYFTE